MRIDIMTLFPETTGGVLHESIIGRAGKKGIVDIRCWQIRDYTENRQMQVDDYPYGGGRGCVMMAQPLKSCLDAIIADAGQTRRRVIYMSPQGKPYDQAAARRLASDYDQLVLVCGHYEGIDERFIEECVDEEISLGDFVLTGGEIAAMAVADSVCRMIPGVLSEEICFTEESHWDGLLEYPQYTRPEEWQGRRVPEVLLSGDHAKVDRWRRRMSLERTMQKRPDMFEKADLSSREDRKLLEEIEKNKNRVTLTEKTVLKMASEEDLPVLTEMIQSLLPGEADRLFVHELPSLEENLLWAVQCGECWIFLHGEEPAGFFCLREGPAEHLNEIRDGKWHYDGAYGILDSFAVIPRYRGSGLSDRMIREAEVLAGAQGKTAVRVEIHRRNEAAKKLLDRCSFRFRGNSPGILPDGQEWRGQGFEKGIS